MRDESPNAKTVVDSRQAPKRLHEGLVPGSTAIFLRVERGPDAGRTADLSAGGVYLIGREGAELALDDGKVSRRHAEIGLYGPGAFILRDLASTNGTRVNGRRVTDRHKLAHWDLIEVGDTAIRFAVVVDSIRPS
jgi:pSer/pThr/pTyr-binding forkhead associated (FHA) protein